jgi:hypothetical protein
MECKEVWSERGLLSFLSGNDHDDDGDDDDYNNTFCASVRLGRLAQ